MAGRTITFDADSVVKNLTYLERVQMPFVMSWALNAMAPQIRDAHKQRMGQTFNNPVPFTLNSVRWGAKGYKPWVRSDKSNLEMGFWISEDGAKGQPPSYYLFPQVRDSGGAKEVYVTRFTKRVQRMGLIYGNQYLTPLKRNGNVADLLNEYGNIRPGQYTKILFAIGAMESPLSGYAKKRRGGDSFFISPDPRRGGQGMKPGIYRRKGGDLGMVFKTLPKPPTVQPKYDFYGITENLAYQYFPELVEKKLREVMGR